MRTILNFVGAGVILLASTCAVAAQEDPAEPSLEQPAWQSLFDGCTLEGWEVSDFVNPGEIRVEEGALLIGAGQPMSGITYTGEFPTENYEIRLQAKRVEGHDFFCALTVPVEETFCSLVLGGWGGNTTGISSIDGYDASENESSKFIDYADDTWYAIRLRVAEGRLRVWIEEAPEPNDGEETEPETQDTAPANEAPEQASSELVPGEGEPVIDFPLADRNLNTRWEVEPSKPLGIATYSTTGALRQIEYRSLPESP